MVLQWHQCEEPFSVPDGTFMFLCVGEEMEHKKHIKPEECWNYLYIYYIFVIYTFIYMYIYVYKYIYAI